MLLEIRRPQLNQQSQQWEIPASIAYCHDVANPQVLQVILQHGQPSADGCIRYDDALVVH